MSTDSIRVTVRFGEPLRRAVGRYRLEVTLSGSPTVIELLEHLAKTYPDFEASYSGRVMGRDFPYTIFVNRRPVPKEDYPRFTLHDGNIVHILIPIAGGASSSEKPPEIAAASVQQPGGGAPGGERPLVATVLPRSFYERSALEVAPNLLGCLVARECRQGRLVGRIVEVEAYLGREDAASHAYRGPTPRSQVMFGPAGVAYVYLIYGMHHCLNVVTGSEGEGQAVLIRALEPIQGIEIMQKHRRRQDVRHLTSGPGKLCQALAIDKTFNEHDLTTGSTLWIEAGHPSGQTIRRGPRIGVRGDEHALRASWRFYLADNAFVSPARPKRTLPSA